MTNAAATFRSLHHGPALLLLPNAWDAGSARLFESLGAPAIATTSAGVAWARGYPDGHVLPVELLVATVAEIARVIRAPLSVDLEGGYSDDPATVGETVTRVIDAGGVGINIEDGTGSPDLLCGKIEQAKQAGARLGVDVFVNARTDVYLHHLVEASQAVAEATARARRYRDAGADGIFVPGAAKPDDIAALVAAVEPPMNVLALPGVPPAAELSGLGVRRLSAGTGICQALWNQAAEFAQAFMRDGLRPPPADGAWRYPDINALFAGR